MIIATVFVLVVLVLVWRAVRALRTLRPAPAPPPALVPGTTDWWIAEHTKRYVAGGIDLATFEQRIDDALRPSEPLPHGWRELRGACDCLVVRYRTPEPVA